MSANDSDDTQEQFETIPEVPVNDELIQALREAGASEFCINIVRVDPEDVDGAERNSVRSEIQKYCYWADEISAEALEDNKHYGGHFFTAVWNGDMKEARGRADSNNQKILDYRGVPGRDAYFA